MPYSLHCFGCPESIITKHHTTPRQELEAERNAAQQQLHRLHAHIEEQENILDRRFEDSEAEIARRIAERLDEANMAKRTSNDRLQKLKIQALSTASALSDHEFRANALARTKKQLLHDFKVLQALRQRFSLEQNRELVELQEEVKAYQVRASSARVRCVPKRGKKAIYIYIYIYMHVAL